MTAFEGGGLNATELGELVAALAPRLRGARVTDVARLRDRDDLQLVLEADERRTRLLVAPGGRRARIAPTRRRFPRAAFATGPDVDGLRRVLCDRTVADLARVGGDRRAVLTFTGEPALRLEIELFGPRGLWCLVEDDRVLELSRPVSSARRTLRRGGPWQPPPPVTTPGQEPPPSRFPPPVPESVDAAFTALDEAEEAGRARDRLLRAAAAARRKLDSRIAGLDRQLEGAARAGELREQADLLLAHAHTARRGADHLEVPDPHDPERTRTLPLDPARPVPVQAQALYARARKLEDGIGVATRRRDEARARLAELDRLVADTGDDPSRLESWLAEHGHLPRTTPATRPERRREPAADGLRRFRSAEGHTILVGRSNRDNDRLTVRVARGNDLWMHVGDALAGSHVVIRVPRGKSASLETMLDAGHLAVHFSKARGRPEAEVLYTHAKHVRKPKGSPAGAVLPHRTRTLRVRMEPARLQRLLDSGGTP